MERSPGATAPLNLLFDLDGTLTDPAPGITRCLARACERVADAVAAYP